MKSANEVMSSGIAGLDYVLGGGFTHGELHLIRGISGTGKTTTALQFLIEGARRGEGALYIGTAQSRHQLEVDARSHGWSLDGVSFYHIGSQAASSQSVMHPADVELPQIISSIDRLVRETNPGRIAIDSLDEIRVLAREPDWYRRQLFELKDLFENLKCTVLLTEVPNAEQAAVDSIVSGLIDLERASPMYGPVRRRLQIGKLRARDFETGYHDYRIRRGGIVVFPRLVASGHHTPISGDACSTGIRELDTMLGGVGLDRGATVLFMGPAGTGKSSIATQCVVAAAQRGEPSSVYCFDERLHTYYQRAAGIGLPVKKFVDAGLVKVTQVDPAEMSPGEFSHSVQNDVEERDVRMVVIDSLNGYSHAMPDNRYLSVHLHELSSYLNQCSVTTLLTMAQHGLFGGGMSTPFEVSYIADTVLLLRLFEHRGAIHKAISTHKRRGGFHEAEIRRFEIGSTGIEVGEPLERFRGVVTGTPEYFGDELSDAD